MRFVAGLAGLTASLTMVATAQAAVVAYTISGDGSGSLGGASFTDAAFTIELVGDTDNVLDFGFGAPFIVPLERATVRIDGFADALVIPSTRFGINRSADIFFFSLDDGFTGGHDLFDFRVTDAEESAFDFFAPYGPVAGAALFIGQLDDIDTSRGALSFEAAGDVTFSAAQGGAVPEPATWAMMVLGFGGIGGALRARRRSPSCACRFEVLSVK